MQRVVLLLLVVHVVSAGKHSLQYFYTGTSGLPNFPEFVTVGIVDGQPFTYYDSNIRRETPRQEWMAKSVEKDYWEEQTQVSIGIEQSFVNNINVAKDRFNQTGGVHVVQQMYGCSWDAETGDVDGFDEHGYDGEDFLSLDLKNLRYITTMPAALITQGNWNNDKAFLEGKKQYRTQQCIEWLKKYLLYGQSTLEKEVSPQVSLLQKSSSSPVVCHASGFYPSGIKISWQKNGQDYDEDVELGELLPNADGTFQKTSTLNVKPEEWKKDTFSCMVEHQKKTIRKILSGKEIRTNEELAPIGLIVGVVAALLLLVVIAVAGYMVYQKKKGFKPVSGSDDGSNSSAHTVRQA